MNIRNNRHILYLKIFSILLFASLCVSCKKAEYKQAQGVIWNTTYNIVYESDKDLTDSILNELKKVDVSVSAFNPQSVVSKINKNESSEVDSYFKLIYNNSVAINRHSGGAFDPTLAPLINLYGFGYENSVQIDTTRLDEILNYVGIERTHLEGDKLIKDDSRTEFNFSAIAKGFGCDCVAAMFRRNGVGNYMVEIGGEISMSGKNPKGEKWKISIDRPVFDAGSTIHESQAVVELTDCSMATSGNYRNFKDIDGKRVVHTIDRFTGKPALNDLLSVTIIVPAKKTDGNGCMKADAYATACMSLGSEKAKELILSQQLQALLIMTDGSLWYSPDFPEMK